MLSKRPSLCSLALLSLACASVLNFTSALPIGADLQARQRVNAKGRKAQQQQAAAVGSSAASISATGTGAGKAATGKNAIATDGSTIVDKSVVINGLTMRFKVSAPADALVAGGAAAAGTLGLNVLLHGDGGQSFFDFPNQGVKGNLMGVALLSPDPNLRWGGSGAGLDRPDGAAHAAAINQLLTKVLPTVVNFDPTQIFLQGVSGGSLLMSGFLMPTFGASLAVPGVLLGCGALPPQVAVQGDISGTRIHFQSSTDDLAELQESIPQAILAYEKIASDAGLSTAEINALQTADASPVGGHCEFDGVDFVSGVQLVADNYDDILAGKASLNGVTVGGTGVVGNEQLFGASGAGAGAVGAKAGNGRTAVGGAKNRNKNRSAW